MRKISLPLVLCVIAALPALADVKGGADKPRASAGSGIAVPGQNEPGRAFVEANLLETFYHELGHALIDVMGLEVFGPEEFAADFFAAYMLDRMHPDARTKALVGHVARAYRLDSDGGGAEGGTTAMWDVHGRPMQRYYNLACLYYGADPQKHAHALKDFALPEARAQTCEAEYEAVAYAWGGVLETLGEDAPGDSIAMDWVLDETSPAVRFIGKEVARLNRIMVLPEPISVSVIPCGEVNAFYDPEPREILMCTEWAEHLAEIAP